MLLRPLRHLVKRLSKEASMANLKYATDVSEIAGTMQEIRVFDVEVPVQRRMQAVIDRAAVLDRRAGFVSQLGGSVYQGFALLLIVGALALVWSAHMSGLASFGGILLIVLRSLTYGQAAQGQMQSLHSSAPYVEMLEEERMRFRESSNKADGLPLTRIGELRFDHVSFEYTAGRPVLTDISFTVEHGEVIGIVGPSGAGKSTLVQLVLRLRRPTQGRILADGVDIAEFAQADWFKRVSFVPQDARLFSGTIAENIVFYRDGVSPEAIERAARAANLHEEILRMPDGYDQWVGEGGMRLSGGQRQRLCIARAMVESPDVLVLDEPTSALDVRSEALIRETVSSLAPTTTVFVIAHRLSTLDVCDRIMVIHDGQLQGFGTSSYLEANDPFYQEALVISGLR
jgi:ABC-type multidrug transport system fused ATPase/permease subunit